MYPNTPQFFHLYNFLIGLLFKRIPNLAGCQGGLMDDRIEFLDSVVVGHYDYLEMDFEKLFLLLLHCLKPDFEFFFREMKELQKLCLGGLLVEVVEREVIDGGDKGEMEKEWVKVRAVYDDWESVLVL
ncbi:unnamed protein product [Ambrosiozyma monospora]|uniref:Unnamed protein product n=1 Tax=Ambrosiozyma monospora TaxID=43982 RepID=A0ACB5T8W2_AMBMO|nr:unnamed protein product [Ambrosiozyma monospora]